MVVHAVGTPSDSKCRIAAMGGVRLVSTKSQIFFCLFFVSLREEDMSRLLFSSPSSHARGDAMVRPSGPRSPSVKSYVLLCACGTL